MTTGTTAASALPAAGGTSTQGLADWAAPYITNYLGQAQALSQSPYQVYQGPLTADYSPLQTQAFQGIGSLTVPSQFGTASTMAQQAGQAPGAYNPVGGSFTDAGVAQQYMNPYLNATLQPQLDELQRRSTLNLNPQLAKFAQAGAYGGSREALLRSEAQRNLLDQVNQTTGQAYNTAFGQAQNQFNTEQQRKIQEAQFGAGYGLDSLKNKLGAAQTLGTLGQYQQQAQNQNFDQMLRAGLMQRDVEQQGITADLNEFNAQREFPYKQLQFQRDMISGLPTSSVTNSPAQLSGIAQLIASIGGVDKLLSATGGGSLSDLLGNLGFNFGGDKV